MHIDIKLARRFRFLVLVISVLSLANHATSALASPESTTGGENVSGSGIIKKEIRELGHFSAISLNVPANVELRQGNTERVTIETDDNLLPLIETVVEDGALNVRLVQRNISVRFNTLKIIIEARTINSIVTGSAGSIYAESLRVPRLRADISGSATLRIKSLDSDSLTAALGGSGTFQAGGRANTVSLSIEGSGSIEAAQLSTKNVNINVAGAGKVVVWARDTLSLRITGAGDVKYYGDPKISKSVTGAGSVMRLGSAP